MESNTSVSTVLDHNDSFSTVESRLLYNDYKNGMKLAHDINTLLRDCDEFYFSVAFVAQSGIEHIKQTLLDIAKRGVKGKIITSTYLGFNSPDSFRELLKFNNIEVKIYNDKNSGFHPKGYIFKKNNEYKIIVGSTNLTQSALTINQEWNLLFTSEKHNVVVDRILEEFHNQWLSSFDMSESWINEYAKSYQKPESYENYSANQQIIKPNKMQKEALGNLLELRNNGKDKALLISATGTGKTYLAAFDVKQFNAKRVLFVIHRETIAKAAIKTFKKLMPEKSCGLFTGNKKDVNCDFVFSTIQTIHKENYLTMFERDAFDYIIIDEVHRAGAKSYDNTFDYFTPKFLLGMTATPERTDGFDIYKLFDYNIAYEIRLSQAMEYDLLCPFHYYGITDLEINGETIDDYSEFNILTNERRIDYIIDKIKIYGYSGEKVKGLIFCSRLDEAKQLSNLFNQRGFKTIALTGEDSEDARESAMNRLEANDSSHLDYIFTVDIFNEGVDIPQINQIVMLRPTQSAIIFVQQLGRGLRKNQFKDYVVVIDFIGNYSNNFLIPIALSGNLSYNKDDYRRFVSEGTLVIPGSSSISFDEITKKRIYTSIDQANFTERKLLVDSYNQLKKKLGRIPYLSDFEKYESLDVLRIFENKGFGSYHNFLKSVDKEYNIKFSELQEKYLAFVSSKYSSGKRVKELLAIKLLIGKTSDLFKDLNETLKNYNETINDYAINTLKNELQQNFITGSGATSYKDLVFIEKNNCINANFAKCLNDQSFKNQLSEVVDFGIARYKSKYFNKYDSTDFVLNEKYTYDDVCRLLNWDKSIVALNIGGYKYDKLTNTFPVFINYDKEDTIQDSIKYNDVFIDEETLISYSKANRDLNSEEVKRIYNYQVNKMTIYLFVRKNKDDKGSKEFYYLGKMKPIGNPEQETMSGTNQNVVKFYFKLSNPVRKDVYEFITK